MTASYLLRMDDACHTMNRHKWQIFEDLFDDFGIKPLVAVVPDNHDSELVCAEPDLMFWDKVRSWQDKGWTIAMHGYQHLMHHTESKMVLPFYKRSEFTGLPYEEQAEKIRQSWYLFTAHGIEPTVWIAPAHCFDWLTLKAIQAETSIRIVSDGIARNQYYEAGFYWIPQQLWSLTEKNDGLWTVCLHPNTMTDQHIASLRQAIEGAFSDRIIAMTDIGLQQRQKSPADRLEDFNFWQRHRLHKLIRQVKGRIRG